MTVKEYTGQNAELFLSKVLQQTSACMNDLSIQVLDLEHSIWETQALHTTPVTQTKTLQTLDFLKQAIDDLAAMLDHLGNQVPASLCVNESDVVAPIKLEALRQSVLACETRQSLDTKPIMPQNVELF